MWGVNAPSPNVARYDYDVAVSFASEDRVYVEAVVRRLKQHGITVFYDEDELATMWGENLVDFLNSNGWSAMTALASTI
jgi:hypothetical protein